MNANSPKELTMQHTPNDKHSNNRKFGTLLSTAKAALVCSLLIANLVLAQVAIEQRPLIAAEAVPGNLVLTPSVEWPTINSVANINAYAAGIANAGYFDPAKCYAYHFSINEPDRHFFPVSFANNGVCVSTSTSMRWSGHFLNWAATQTIDPFRRALTGGLRVRDTATETWLEKARHDGQGGSSIFPMRTISGNGLITGATPFNGYDSDEETLSSFRTRIHGLGNRMHFVINNADTSRLTASNATIESFNPGVHGRNNLRTNRVYEVSIRVRVCDAISTHAAANGGEAFLEDNCVRYPRDPSLPRSGFKPEGLIQEFSEQLRFSVFGYLNDSNMLRDGAALRARQKYVGPRRFDAVNNWTSNPNQEWDPNTGVLFPNPDPADASATRASNAHHPTITRSGIINYINQFGQMTNRNHKSFDPVSEMYYAALRYIRGLANVPEYTMLNAGSAAGNFELADGFPVITDWADPFQFWCQPTAILGIGDVYTHRDKNLPGNTARTDEPAVPPLVSDDTAINVVTETQRVFRMEGITGSVAEFTGRQNSAYIAGMAFFAHTRDLRSDLRGIQTASTHWVDVRENQVLEGRTRNQFWLAAKYGGFRVPQGFDPLTHNTALPQSWWSRGGEVLAGSGATAFIRADNFYVASDAGRMISSLRSAFEQIVAEQRRTGASLAANSSRLEVGTTVYQSIYMSASFEGDLLALQLDPTTGAVSTERWRASAMLPAPADRRIFANIDDTNRHTPFAWSNTLLRSSPLISPWGSNDAERQQRIDYMRGVRSAEQPNGPLRTRSGLLGSIIHSQPVHVGRPAPGLFSGRTFAGSGTYEAFVASQSNRTPVIYVGSNAGKLHGFNAGTGREMYAFIPRTVLQNQLHTFASPDFEHRYFVDGEITVADAFFGVGAEAPRWRTVLVSTLGRGGRGIFALDITNPDAVSLLWERNHTQIPALGNSLGKPLIAQVGDGDWRVLIGNGPNGTNNRAQLISVQLSDGTASEVDTGAASSIGLSAVNLWDANNDGFFENAYAGDFAGNMWRFSNLSSTASAHRLFTATSAANVPQPITSAPAIARNPDNPTQTWVFFGTGQYLNQVDLTSTAVQTWYGLIDGPTITSRNLLNRVGWIADVDVPNVDFDARVLDVAPSVVEPQRGWLLDFPVAGERMVLPNQFRGRTLIGTTRIPDATDRCAPTGRGFIMAVDPFTGGSQATSFFDFNRDGIINDADRVVVGGVARVVSGIGIANAPFSPIFTGNIMQINREDATIQQIATGGDPSQQLLRRTSWREIRR